MPIRTCLCKFSQDSGFAFIPALEHFMPLFVWDSSYSVKVQRCDQDHKKLFSLTNDLYEAMRIGKGSQVVGHIVEELKEYTKSHFAAEEALMEKAGYPALITHREEHRKLIESVDKLQKDMKDGTVGQSVGVATFLNDWLVNHIKKTDQLYSAHLNANGIA
jgi:hemerythrin-like metal-binding protein